jgi:hypothetical protein
MRKRGNNTSTYRKEKRVIWNYANEFKKKEMEKRLKGV